MRFYFILLLSSTISCTSELDVVQQDLKIVQSGEDVNLTCYFSEFMESTAWFKQTAKGKSSKIVSIHYKQPNWNKDFEKMNRFNVTKGDRHFNLIILQTKPSDSATYYCVVASNWKSGMGAGTRLLIRDAAVGHTTVQQSLIDTLHQGDSVNLQCSVFSESCAGEHSVYWFRQSLGDSQGVLYTKGERNGQCKNSNDSQTQSCVYNLLKSNISDSDAGIYYCAVAACGEILFGKGTQLNIKVCSSDESSNVDVVQEDVKVVRAGEDVNLTCSFSTLLQSTRAWFKRASNGKSIQIVSLYLNQQPSWNKDFEKMNRFNITKGDDHFNLTILQTKPSDSATYYCVVSSYYTIGMGAGTRLFFKAGHTTVQQSLIDTLHPGDSVNLQCSVFSESCAGEHSVYWFRQSLGDSQGVLYTKGERNGQCKNSNESQTQSCVYNLLKSNISDSDAGIYYCAVAACGEILFGEGNQLNFRESGGVNPSLLALGISNIILFALVVFLGIKLLRSQIKVLKPQENQNEDSMNYAAISFGQKPLNTRRTKSKVIQEQSLYAQVRSQQ
ncbi:uncharacterized protein LOC120469634 [Pimephales promelas]|uniref:uncharacterized protein LOC120469634 n=1 Tax=Pimephales promelas TaxID=90988 RepID=UPI001955CB71|nr:uncharacterized protein LOC120469634 [Pimephales promelas]